MSSRAGSPRYIFVPRAGSPRYIYVPGAACPRYIYVHEGCQFGKFALDSIATSGFGIESDSFEDPENIFRVNAMKLVR